MRFTHGGNLRALAERAGCAPEDILDFSASINPLGPPDWLREEISRAVSELVSYPDPDCRELVGAASARFDVDPSEVVCGNGSTEALFTLARVLGARRALIPVPAYTDYKRACEAAGLPVRTVPLEPFRGFEPDFELMDKLIRPGDAVFLGRPNNPTGVAFESRALADLARANPRAAFIIDEAFIDFSYRPSIIPERAKNEVVIYSLTKIFAAPGLRLGFAFAAPDTAARVRDLIPPWSVNTPAQAFGTRALADAEYVKASRRETRSLYKELRAGLEALPGVWVNPSEANFMLCRVEGRPVLALAEKMLKKHRVAVRVCNDFEELGGEWLRLAVRTGDENRRLLAALADVLGAKRSFAGTRMKKTPAIMIQGTGSNAGKSVIAAALCRVFLRGGLSPAPFKSQNMSLNSYVTRDGREIGRAQATQAAACRREPDARMNPVLLKPGSDTGSQVIVMGRPVGNMSVAQYIDFKPEAWKAVTGAYESLSAEAGIMVIEGAGSPAEINLKSHDIVNMRMAAYAGAPVLLAADIDRGGVFAQLAGTMELLTERERALVAGYVINRFRGDESLLEPALAATTRRTGKPFLGVLPHIANLGLPDEDSVSFKDERCEKVHERDVEIALMDLPRISNFTDIDALRAEPDVHVRVVRKASDLDFEDPPDAVVIPGSKSVAGDLEHLRREGLAGLIESLAGLSEIVGLCGGYQMLGRYILDPEGLESGEKRTPGLGLLPIETVLSEKKTLTLVNAEHTPSGLAMSGYEIHHGVTRAARGALPAVIAEDGREIGHSDESGLVWGAYLHGAFDSGEFRRFFINRLRRRKGLGPIHGPAAFDLDSALDRLADLVREHLDIERIYRLAGI